MADDFSRFAKFAEQAPTDEQPEDFSRFSKFAATKKAPAPKQYTRYSGPNAASEDPEVPGRSRVTRLGSPDANVSRTIGFKETNADREAAAREFYPNARVYTDQQGTVTVDDNGTVYNFERPDFGHAIAGAVRGVADIGVPEQFQRDRSLREEDLVGRLIRQNADASLPNIATRGAANFAAAALSGGASIPVQAAVMGGANGAVPYINQAINEHTAGGDTQTDSQVNRDAMVDTAIGAGSVLVPGAIAGLKNLSSEAQMNRALQHLLQEEGRTNPELARQLALTGENLPLSSMLNEGDTNALQLQKLGRNPDVARVDSAARENIIDLADQGAAARSEAAGGVEQARYNVQDALGRAKDTVREAKNTAALGANEAEKQIAKQEAEREGQRVAQEQARAEAVRAQNEQYARDTANRAAQVQANRQKDAVAKERYNADRAQRANEEAARNAAVKNENQSVKDNTQIRFATSREAEELRPAIPKAEPRLRDPAPVRSVDPVKPTKPASIPKPVRPAKAEKPVAEPYQEPATGYVNDAKKDLLKAKANERTVAEATRPFDEMAESLKKASRRIAKAQPESLAVRAAKRIGKGVATGGLSELVRASKFPSKFMSGRAALRVASDPKLMRQMQELASKGERLDLANTKTAEEFQRELGAFLAEMESE